MIKSDTNYPVSQLFDIEADVVYAILAETGIVCECDVPAFDVGSGAAATKRIVGNFG